MKKLLLGLLLLSSPVYASTVSLETISPDSSATVHNTNFTNIGTVLNGNVEGSCDGGSTVCNVKADSLFEINFADDANPRLRDSELLNITVDTISSGAVSSQGTVVESGCVQATDSDLTADVSACVAYINGYRVSKSATSQTYANNTTTYLWLSQTGSYTQSTNPNTSISNSSLLASVVTSAGAITTVNNLFTTRVPGLIIPANYRDGLYVSRDSATTIAVFPGSSEINSSIVTKTSTSTLTLSTAGDWAGGSSLAAANTYGYVGIDTSGNLKLHTTAPTHDNYAVSTTAGKKRYATWSSTVYRILGWFRMNGSSQLDAYTVSNIKEGNVPNSIFSIDSSNVTTSSATNVPLPGMSIKFYSSGNPVLIRYDGAFQNDNSAGNVQFALSSDSSALTGSEIDLAGTGALPTSLGWVQTYSQGTHDFDVTWSAESGTTARQNGIKWRRTLEVSEI